MLGILGGMGPLATVDFMRKLTLATRAERDQDHLPVIVWNVPQIPDRTAAIMGTGPSPYPGLAQAARCLKELGAQRCVMPCNTAHHWVEELEREVRLPFVHIADAVIARLRANGIKPADRVVVLSTRGTIQSGFYRTRLSAAGFMQHQPTDAQGCLIDAVIGYVKAGRLGQATDVLRDVVETLIADGAQWIVLACTELPLVAPKSKGLVDATQALAEEAVLRMIADGERLASANSLATNKKENRREAQGAMGASVARRRGHDVAREDA
ncbi:aspartate/glutamate racemase family protein [Chelativorans sp. YIM 93263]|uniref:aspartate/glutamate racemase family protein n=1 Tax=Chelativorans sp. YIM 93263 TaxID=2906648 RepID=UPI002379028F|nr:amino acid racemase [Chelativorans sp. YIM 93263]